MTSVVAIVDDFFPSTKEDDVVLGVLPFYHIYGKGRLGLVLSICL